MLVCNVMILSRVLQHIEKFSPVIQSVLLAPGTDPAGPVTENNAARNRSFIVQDRSFQADTIQRFAPFYLNSCQVCQGGHQIDGCSNFPDYLTLFDHTFPTDK